MQSDEKTGGVAVIGLVVVGISGYLTAVFLVCFAFPLIGVSFWTGHALIFACIGGWAAGCLVMENFWKWWRSEN